MTDLVMEFIEGAKEEKTSSLEVLVISILCLPLWEIYAIGAANQKGFGLGIVLVSPEKITVEKSLRLIFPATNNEAEYEALLARMMMVSRLGGKVMEIFLDSRLVVRQIKGEFKAKDQ